MAKQTELPGTERPSIAPIEDAAEFYRKTRDSRMKLTEREIVAKTNLIQVMQEHQKQLSKNEDGDFVYRYDDEIVILKNGKVNVKVKAVHDDESDDGDE